MTPTKPEITGFAEKVVGTVVCKEAHNLTANDRISVSLTPGITTSFQVEFDDTTRRTFVNPINFGASVKCQHRKKTRLQFLIMDIKLVIK